MGVVGAGALSLALAAGATAASAAPSAARATTAAAPAATSSENRSAGHLYVAGGPLVVSQNASQEVAHATDRVETRIAGQSRYATAAAVASTGWPSGADEVLIATGENFPDGLAASAVAGGREAPLLLTASQSLPLPTQDELIRLEPTTVHVIGGPGAVSEGVVLQIQEILPQASVLRIAGGSRYETAAAVSRLTPESSDNAFVATGANFPDALSAGPAAARLGAPLLLTAGTDLSAPTAAELRQRKPARTFVVGGPGVVSDRVVSQIRQATGGTVERLSGTSRFDTAAAVSNRVFAPTTPALVLATGKNFPDALAAGALAGAQRSPLLLDGGGSSAPRATVDSGRRVSWWTPESGRVLRYNVIVHPDDEMSSISVARPDPGRYDVFIVLTRGETTIACNGKPVSNPWSHLEYVPQPQPIGTLYSNKCRQQRLDSWVQHLTKSGLAETPRFVRRKGVPVTFDGRLLPTPTHKSENLTTATADYFDVAVGANSALIAFDMGSIAPDEVLWALENVRLQRAALFPTALEGDVVVGGYYNATGTGSQYTNSDHRTVHRVVSTTDLGLPGSQYAPVGHSAPGRAFGDWVDRYCAHMCHPNATNEYRGPVGTFQWSYGWLGKGQWASGTMDVGAGFSRYQSFAKWF
ncbi:lytic transglycosylase [Knoellia sinensis KCTC 19936]|uniref:Lytic transglycosylase n=1 Tax=Knoellia sinensis KCTC 19936 TaxID=1385520 RepID=A0A0A0J8G8_9MICO|nr:lytic transglycosylase [Knoellia sinensis KCTC 19936]